MGFLDFFKKKQSFDSTLESTAHLSDLPPIEPDLDSGKLPPPFPEQGIPQTLSDISSSQEIPSPAKLPEDAHHYDSQEAFCLDLRPKSVSLQDDVGVLKKTNGDYEVVLQKNIVVKKQENESEFQEVPNVVIHKEINAEKKTEFLSSRDEFNAESESNISSLPSFSSQEEISFENLPSFDDEDLRDAPSSQEESAQAQENDFQQNMSTIQEVYVEKHKYTKIITEWKSCTQELHKKVKAEKSFDHFDPSIQSACTKSNISFAKIQKAFAKIEETLSQET
jgi:hypothetical protein